MRSVGARFDRLRREPEIFVVHHGRVRRARVRRFPDWAYFVIRADHVDVLSIYHERRRPRRFEAWLEWGCARRSPLRRDAHEANPSGSARGLEAGAVPSNVSGKLGAVHPPCCAPRTPKKDGSCDRATPALCLANPSGDFDGCLWRVIQH